MPLGAPTSSVRIPRPRAGGDHAGVKRPLRRRQRDHVRSRHRMNGTVASSGPTDLRPRERVRRHVHAPRPAPPQPRRGGPLPVPPGRQLGPVSSNVFLENGARLYLDVGSHPEYATPECDSIYDLVVHDKAGERILEHLLLSAEQRLPGGGHPRRHLPVQEQHRLGRQLLRLPRELPHQPARRLRPLRRGADPVLRVPPDLRRRRQGAADGRGAPCTASASGPSTSGRACAAPPPAAARSSTPATSPTPTPSASAAST